MRTYDLITVGGGLAGASLALAMSKHGERVLIIEREDVFKDRVRGEGMTPWGTAEARELGIYELLRDACALELRWFDTYAGPGRVRRDVIETTPQHTPCMDFLHPQMQETLLRAAMQAGAEVRRGASVIGLVPGEAPRVKLQHGATQEEVSARLIVGADGRASNTRAWAGFSPKQDPHRLFIGGVLLEGSLAPKDAISLIQGIGRAAIFYPQREGKVRVYAVYHRDIYGARLQGSDDLPRFFQEVIQAGAPPEWLAGARAVGPLATFEGADTWVDHPYQSGVVLVGDAAAACDPSYGQGLSLTLRDVRTLRDKLLQTSDWDKAGHAYAEEHDRYYEALHLVEDWYIRLFMETGSAADARRAKALPLIMMDPTRVPDVLISGPNQPLGEADRVRFIGE